MERGAGVIAQLRRGILDGSLIDGRGRLPSQAALGQRYGASRPVIREAMAHLEAQGLIVLDQGRRARVQPPDPAAWASSLGAVIAAGAWEPGDLLAARRLVEGEVAALAAARGEPQVIAALRREIEAYRGATTRAAALAADRAFHAAIAAGAGNPVLELLHRSLLEVIAAQQQRTHRGRDLPWVPRDHQRILAAIAAGDPERARAAMGLHLDRVADVLVGAQTSNRRK